MRKFFKKIATSALVAALICVSGVDSLAGANIITIESKAADVVYTYYSKCNSQYTSFVDALESLEVDSSMSSRMRIAALNGIDDYAAIPSQDMILLDLLKKGKLVKSKQRNIAELNSKSSNVKVNSESPYWIAVTGLWSAQTEAKVYVGENTLLQVAVKPVNASSRTLKWTSDNNTIVKVDRGIITGVKAGKTYVRATSVNGKSVKILVTVENKPATNIKKAQMVSRIRNNTSLRLTNEKKNTLASMAEVLLNDGYEPAFVAGILGNIIHEGNVGQFESSNYKAYPSLKPRYLKLMDDEYDYARTFSGQNVTDSTVSLAHLDFVVRQLESDGWNYGKFGLGCVQWTGSRTKTLVDLYLQYSSDGQSITKEQAIRAEAKMLSCELAGNYSYVYRDWKSSYAGKYNTDEAAFAAGSTVCIRYEVPSDRYYKASNVRGPEARRVYHVMIGK